MAHAALPWRADLFNGRVLLAAGAPDAFGPPIVRAWQSLGGTAIEGPAGDAGVAEAQIGAAWSAAGALDTLVVLATGVAEDPAAFDPIAWRDGVDQGLSHPWYVMQAAARQWRDRGRAGHVVVLLPPYRESRPSSQLRRAVGASLAHLAKTVAVEWAAHDVRVNCIAPATDDTEAVANAVVWLSAPSGKFVTGEVMNLGSPR